MLTPRYEKNDDSSCVPDLKELMTAIPMTAEAHAAIRRKKVETRRSLEDALEAARQDKSPLDE